MNIEGWQQVGELTIAFGLSAAIGFEREIRQKSAGLRTHTLVGTGAALFVLISKYGFTDVLVPGKIVVDPSRVAAQIVSGIGFIGGGLIFVRRDAVRGLTTAAAVWVTAAIGAAAGAALPVLAMFATAAYFVVVLFFPLIVTRLPRSAGASSTIHIRYLDGRGILREVLRHATGRGFVVGEVATAPSDSAALGEPALVEVSLEIHGTSSVSELAAELSEVDGVHAVFAGDANVTTE